MTALRRWGRPVLCALLFLCLALSRSAAKRLELIPRLYTTSLSGFPLTGEAAHAMEEREAEEQRPAAFTLWKEEKEQALENPDLSRSAAASVISLSGSSTLLFSSSAPLLSGDTEGCLLDEITAQSLFGSPDPVGAALFYGGRRLTVRGVIETERPLLLCQAEQKTEGLTRLTLRPPEGAPIRDFLAEFSSRHGLSGSWASTDTWKGLARFCSLLSPFLFFLSLFFPLLKAAFSSTEFPASFFLCLLTAGAVWFFMLWITEASFQLPEEFLPNKWSDFDFWGDLWQQKKEELLLFLTMEKTEFELRLLLPALRALLFGLLSLMLFPFSLRKGKPKTGRGLWLWCAFALLLPFFASLFLDPALAKDRLLWLCLPTYLALSFLCQALLRTVKRWTAENA